MRLTNIQRSKIVSEAVDAVFQKEVGEELYHKVQTLVEQYFYDEHMTDELKKLVEIDRRIVNTNPNLTTYLTTCDSAEITLPNFNKIYVAFLGVSIPVPRCNYGNFRIQYKDLPDHIQEAVDAYLDFNESKNSFRYKLRAIVASVYSTKKAKELLPEISSIIDNVTGEATGAMLPVSVEAFKSVKEALKGVKDVKDFQ